LLSVINCEDIINCRDCFAKQFDCFVEIGCAISSKTRVSKRVIGLDASA